MPKDPHETCKEPINPVRQASVSRVIEAGNSAVGALGVSDESRESDWNMVWCGRGSGWRFGCAAVVDLFLLKGDMVTR